MNSKIITVWGGKQCGKTTFVVSLAAALSKRVLVGLISSNLTYGELQIFFGQSVPPEKGIYQSLRDDNPNIGEKFVEYENSKNLFFLSVPTHNSNFLCDTITIEEVERMMNTAALVFDILLIDGATEVNNPISSVGLWLSDRIFTLHRPSVAAQMWYRGVSDFVRELNVEEKQTHIMQAPRGEFDDKTYQSMIGLNFAYTLPYIKQAGELENAGTPLCLYRDRACQRYGKVLESIVKEICGGGKP